jgi:hypothetical protein
VPDSVSNRSAKEKRVKQRCIRIKISKLLRCCTIKAPWLPWSEGPSTHAVVGRAVATEACFVNRSVNELEPVLATMGSCDTGMASAILFKVFSRLGSERMRICFLLDMRNETNAEQNECQDCRELSGVYPQSPNESPPQRSTRCV